MSFKPFAKLYVTVNDFLKPNDILRVVNQLQSNIEQSFLPLINNKLQNDSLILTNIELTAGQANVIDHKLGRKLTGWHVIRLRSNAIVYDDQDNNSLPGLNLILHTSANTTVDLLVF